MTKLLEQAVTAVWQLPADNRDRIARTMLTLTGLNDDPAPLDGKDRPNVLEGLSQALGKDFSTHDEVEAAFLRFDS